MQNKVEETTFADTNLFHFPKIRIPKVAFRVFEIQNFIIRFHFYLTMKNEIEIIVYYFHV